MKPIKMTIGRHVAFGFGLVLSLGAGLGALTVWEMAGIGRNARFLTDAVAPQAAVAGKLTQASAELQRAARTYSFTGDPDQLASAKKHLGEVGTIIGAARRLSDEQPALVVLHEKIGVAEKAVATYTTDFEATVANMEALARVRAQLETEGNVFVQAIGVYIDAQDKELAAGIVEGLPAAKLEEARRKLGMARDIAEKGNEIRLVTLAAQAMRQPAMMDKLPGIFDALERIRRELAALPQEDVDRKELVTVGQAIDVYRQGIGSLAKNAVEAGEITARRYAVVAELDVVLHEILDRAIQRTLGDTRSADTSLTAASRLVVGGMTGMVVLGLVVAFFIIRKINRVLTKTVEALSQGAVQVAAASSQVSASSQSLAEGASEQAASLEEIGSSVEELTAMTKRNAENAQSGKAVSAQAREAAEAGTEEMERMQVAMNAIQQSSNDVSKIIKTIDEIAFQTNILALNAAVEAARAGEAGAGFAVVAEEVRSLAQRSAVAARETADKIEDATTRSTQGVALSGRVAGGLRQILEKSREVDRLVGEIATASHEQSEGLAQINSAIGQMDKVTQSSAANAEETASAAEELNAQSEELSAISQELACLVGTKSDAVRVAGDRAASPVRSAPARENHLPRTSPAVVSRG